jgi:hypothetical protein
MENYRRHLKHFNDAYFNDLSARLVAFIAGSERFCDRVSGRWLALTWQVRAARGGYSPAGGDIRMRTM